jgi:hypothetical protein
MQFKVIQCIRNKYIIENNKRLKQSNHAISRFHNDNIVHWKSLLQTIDRNSNEIRLKIYS